VVIATSNSVQTGAVGHLAGTVPTQKFGSVQLAPPHLHTPSVAWSSFSFSPPTFVQLFVASLHAPPTPPAPAVQIWWALQMAVELLHTQRLRFAFPSVLAQAGIVTSQSFAVEQVLPIGHRPVSPLQWQATCMIVASRVHTGFCGHTLGLAETQ
jgi:hypothetical protein